MTDQLSPLTEQELAEIEGRACNTPKFNAETYAFDIKQLLRHIAALQVQLDVMHEIVVDTADDENKSYPVKAGQLGIRLREDERRRISRAIENLRREGAVDYNRGIEDALLAVDDNGRVSVACPKDQQHG